MRRCGVAAEPVDGANVRVTWPDVYRKRQNTPIEYCSKTIDVRDPKKGETAEFVPSMIACLVGLKPHPDAYRLALEAFRHPSEPTGEERTLITSADGSNELAITPTGEGWVVQVKPDEPANEVHVPFAAGDETDTARKDAIASLYEQLGAEPTSRIMIAPVHPPRSEEVDGWTLSEVPMTQRPEVLVGFAASDDERECVATLYRAMGGEKPQKGERPIDATIADVVLVHERPYTADGDRRTLRPVFPSDMLEVLREVSKLCEGMPGDPGRDVCAVERVRAVLKTFDGMRRRGER